MISFSSFYQYIATYPIGMWLETLPEKIWMSQKQGCHSKFCVWEKSVKHLPSIKPHSLDLLNGIIAEKGSLTAHQREGIFRLLYNLVPWRKGPFSLYGCYIDAEWRSDLKWNRIYPYITPLKNRTVLDVGCGNGYYVWRMVGSGAKLVIGVDPILLFLCQFEAIKKLLGGDFHAYLLPLRLEQLPSTRSFDTVFSMGVLYHCKSPLDHLFNIKKQLKKGGELILESLVVHGDSRQVLVPDASYASMSNIYFIPSIELLKVWLMRCGFADIRLISCTMTSTSEQRRTNWIKSESLEDFLDTNDLSKTKEGYPVPYRAILIAKA